jgi:tellurium resistance protein TerD
MRHSWSVSMDALLSGAPIASGPQTHQSATLDNAGPPPTSPQLTPDPPPLHVSLGSLAGSITPKHHPIGRAAFPTAQHASPEATPAPDAHALRAGQNSVLPPAELGSTIDVLLTWSAHNTVEIDASAILVDADLRVLSDEHFVFFNNLVSPDGSVSLAGDPVVDTGGLSTATITVALDSVDSRASSIVFALSIYDPDTRGQSFAMVQTLNVRVAPHGQTTAHTSFTADRLDGSETAMIMCEIYRRSGAWKIRAVGQGYADGLAGIARDYGVVVS